MFALSGFAALFWQLGVESYTLVSLGLIGAVMAFFFFNVFGSERRGTKTFMATPGVWCWATPWLTWPSNTR